MRESELEFSGSDLHCRVPSISWLTSPSHAGDVTQAVTCCAIIIGHRRNGAVH